MEKIGNMFKEKVRVGIDCDGVLRDFTQSVMNLARKEGVIVPEPDNYEFLGQMIGDHSIAQKIWTTEEWLEPVFVDAPLIEKAKSGYELFCTDPQFEVYIVTAQREGTEEYTHRWLQNHGFKNHVKTIYESKKLNSPCQILIDDKGANVDEFNNNARMGVLVETSYNKTNTSPYKVKNLIEAYNLLK